MKVILTSFQTGKDVVTYVVYSNNIKNPIKTLNTGISEYNTKVISMVDKDGDSVFDKLEEKLKNEEEITKQDLIALTFTPIMGGKLTKLNKIIKSIWIIKKIDNEYKYDIESMLYAFADKFLKGKDLEMVKEEISMTELGRMLIDEGIEKGKVEGKIEGKSELLIKQLLKKFKKVPESYQQNIKKLPIEVLETIATDIFELESVDELEKYF